MFHHRERALHALSAASLLSAVSSTSAAATFAICANRDDWMPDSEQNYLPVSFVLRPSRVLLWAAAL